MNKHNLHITKANMKNLENFEVEAIYLFCML